MILAAVLALAPQAELERVTYANQAPRAPAESGADLGLTVLVGVASAAGGFVLGEVLRRKTGGEHKPAPDVPPPGTGEPHQ